MTDDKEAKQVYKLLTKNYVEDDDAMFRFDYSINFLRWALCPPARYPDWILGVRSTAGKKPLCGFITGIPLHMRINGKKLKLVEINFLCVHKKIRSKGIAPKLIQEITRRVNLRKIF
jgi:glycylpeptide N-tetradecanoyltransferase